MVRGRVDDAFGNRSRIANRVSRRVVVASARELVRRNPGAADLRARGHGRSPGTNHPIFAVGSAGSRRSTCSANTAFGAREPFTPLVSVWVGFEPCQSLENL